MLSLKTKNSNKRRIGSFIFAKSFSSTLILAFVLMLSSMGFAQQSSSVQETKEQCVAALRSNDIDKLIATFSDPIEISLPEGENSYSKTQAAVVIRDFLAKNKVKSFSVKQSGKSTGGAEFIIGEMETIEGKKYQVYFLVTLINKNAYLHLIEFELN